MHGIGLAKADDDHADGKQAGERDADGGVLLDPRFFVDQLDQHSGDDPGDERPDEHRHGFQALRKKERDGQPGQDAVADRIADEGHPAQDQVVADQAAGCGNQEAHQGDPKRDRQVDRPRLHHDSGPVECGNEFAHDRPPYPLGPVALGVNGL